MLTELTGGRNPARRGAPCRRAPPRRGPGRPDRAGELRDDLDPESVIDLLTAPYIYRLLIDGGDLEGVFARAGGWLDVILRGALGAADVPGGRP